MQDSFEGFLRHGGHGRYELARRNGQVHGRRVAFSMKSTLPNQEAPRADFAGRLDHVIEKNTRMLLNALTPPDTVPAVTESDLRDVTDAKDEILDHWSVRLEGIFNEYQTHPQRSRPLRVAMEERLLRAFAGLINQLRSEALGIERCIWRSQDDPKIRDLHADYDGRVFQWHEPPEGGHPGQAHNCRCYAEPVAQGTQSDVTPVDFEPTAGGGVPIQNLQEHEAKGGHTIAPPVGKSEAFLQSAECGERPTIRRSGRERFPKASRVLLVTRIRAKTDELQSGPERGHS